jgi:hypothetical protein
MRPTHPDVAISETSEASEYLLPKPPRGGGEVLVVGGRSGAHTTHRRSAEVAKVLGERIVLIAECQQQFLTELRHGLEELDGAVAEDSRARLKGAVLSALGVLDWCDAQQRDLIQQGSLAARGWQPIDLGEFCREFAAEQPAENVALVVTGQTVRAWWGDAAKLHDVLHAGIAVILERTGGSGSILVEVESAPAGHLIRIAGTGEPQEDLDASVVRNFRHAVERIGAVVQPDVLGAGGAGLVLQLPEATC